MTAAAEKFMAPQAQKPEALVWLQDVPQGNAPAWAQALRETGAEAFAATGLPTPAWEGWQHTNLRPLMAQPFRFAAQGPAFDTAKLPALLFENAHRVVVVNGQYQPRLSRLPGSVTVTALMEAEGAEEWAVNVGDLANAPFHALNSAHVRDGFLLKAEGEAAGPLEVLFYNFGQNAAIHPRVVYLLGRNAGLTVFERHCGEGVYLANSVAQVTLARDSRLKFYRLMEEGGSAHHVSHVTVRQQENSSFEGFSMATGALVARQEFHFQLLDPNVFTGINGIYMLKDRQNHDFTVLMDHFEPYGKSEQYFKGVVDAQARAVFQGKIHVRRAAQKTDGCQSHHALLLSEQSETSAKPELEIYADDVKCSHGATTGHLDPVALFYLRSRGIPEEEARGLLIESFLGQAIEKVTFAPAADIYRQQVTAWLNREKS